MAVNVITTSIANLFGVDVNAIVLLFAIFSAYPVGLVYIFLIRKLDVLYKSVYFLICGLVILAFSYGLNSIHYLVNCCFCYFLLKWLPTKYALLTNFAFTFTYLLYGYQLNQVDWNYSITWTMAQCVLTLKLIAISFDIHDGANKSPNKDVGRHTESAIPNLPPFYLFISYCYFPGTLMVGPIIPYLSYIKFINGSTYNHKAISISLFRLLGGLVCLFIYFYGSIYWPVEYLQSQVYYNSNFWWKLTAMAIVTKIYMYKYVAVWMMAEAACILSGITYDGINYYRHTNVKLFKFELAHTCTNIISSYNMSTNQFAFKYIYRRLKFLGNINLSKLLTLIFLSVWHGFATGYYFAFSTEFLILYFEKHLSTCFHLLQDKYSLNSDYLKPLIWIFGRIYTYYFIGYSFVSFMFLFSDLWFPVLSSVYFAGHLFLLSYIAISFFINKFFHL